MEAVIRAQAIGHGSYELPDSPRFLDLYSPESGLVRLSVAATVPPLDEIKMGDMLTLKCRVGNSEKVVRGEERDRAIKSVRLQVIEVDGLKVKPAAPPERVAA